MKHYFAKIGSILIAVMIIFVSVSTAFAEDTLKINGAKEAVNKGDTVHFTLNLSDTREPVIGFEVRIFYDPAIQGKIPLNWTDFNNPVNCADKTAFFSCDFKAIDGGDTELSYFVTELYGNDMTYLKSYSWTYDLTSGDKAVVSDGVLPVSKDPETLEKRQSHFINYVDGKGEENSPNKDNHESVVGKQHSTLIEQDVVENTKIVDVTKDKGNNSSSNPLIFILIGVPVIIALIVIAIVLANKRNKKNDDGVNEPKFDLNAEQQAMEEAGEIDDEDGM